MPEALQRADNAECAGFNIEAAKALLAEVGYGAMSMRKQARRAGRCCAYGCTRWRGATPTGGSFHGAGANCTVPSG